MTTPTNQPAMAWHRMTARERDAAVGVHVLGMRQVSDEYYWPPAHVIEWAEKQGCAGVGYMRLPEFTTNPEACAQVIKAMQARGFSVGCWWFSGGGIRAGFANSAFPPDRDIGSETDGTFFASGNTMPEVVSLCALRACGVTVETDL